MRSNKDHEQRLMVTSFNGDVLLINLFENVEISSGMFFVLSGRINHVSATVS